LLDR
jgi:tubulin polyglutamylase TTLL9